MPGLDSIIKRIQEDSAAKCDTIIGDAKKKAQRTLDKAKKQAEEESRAAIDDFKKKLKLQAENSKAAFALNRRDALLKKKSEIIDKIIAEAKNRLCGLDDGQYFDVILKQAIKHAKSAPGKMLLGESDIKRLPQGFEAKLNKSLKQGSLKIEAAPRDLGCGFVLVYGDIEENCTFDALFSENRDRIRDKINAAIFS